MRVPGAGPTSSSMGLTNTPLGTIEELKEAKLPLRTVACCAPPAAGRKGCDQYEMCIFRYTNNGGFRCEVDEYGHTVSGNGARNIGYFHQDHEGKPSEHQCSCHLFMSHLAHRMEAGLRDTRQGLPGEIIEVIAQEGEIIHETEMRRVNKNADKPNLPAEWDWVQETRPVRVRKFLRPLERETLRSEAVVMERRRQREAARTEWAEGLPPDQRHRVVPTPDASIAEDEADDTGNEPAAAAPAASGSSAVPVSRRAR